MAKPLTAVLGNKTSLANAGTHIIAKDMKLAEITLQPEFENMFPINPVTLDHIKNSIKERGFDKSQPIHVWKEKRVLIDGHTRRRACKELGLESIPVYEHSFESIDQALEYAYSIQLDRRNLNDAELLMAVNALDKLKKRGKQEESEAGQGKSAELLAQKLGTSRAKVEKIRSINKKATDEVKTAVKSGEMSINSAYETVKKTKQETQKELESAISDIEPPFTPDSATENTVLPIESDNDYLTCVIETLCMLCFEDSAGIANMLYDNLYRSKFDSNTILEVADEQQREVLNQLFNAR